MVTDGKEMYFIYLLLCSCPIDPFTILGLEHLSIDKFQVVENVNQRIFRLGNCERVGWEKKLQTFSQYLLTFIRPWEIFATENIIANRSNISLLFPTSFEKYWSTYSRRLESIKNMPLRKIEWAKVVSVDNPTKHKFLLSQNLSMDVSKNTEV